MIQHFRFRECEHNGDLDRYARDVVQCGGVVIGKELDARAEKGFLTVEFLNDTHYQQFMKNFKKTDAYLFM